MLWNKLFLHTSILVSEEEQEFENFSKKCCFLYFEWKKLTFITFGLP